MTNWYELRRIAIEAWELGRKLNRPKPLRPIPLPRMQPRRPR